MFYDVNWNIFASNGSDRVVLKGKCYPLNAKHANFQHRKHGNCFYENKSKDRHCTWQAVLI